MGKRKEGGDQKCNNTTTLGFRSLKGEIASKLWNKQWNMKVVYTSISLTFVILTN